MDPLPEEGAYGFNLDKSRLPTDWACFRNLCQSIVIHFDKHPEEVLWSTDDNGQHHDPPRTPRIGWVAENQKGEHTSEWTITMSTLKKSDLLHLANTALGRRTLLAQLQEIEPGKL